MKPLNNLIQLLNQDKVIPMIGAGVSYATAGLPNWKGTVESGLQYAEDRNIELDSVAAAKALLNTGKLTAAATIMKGILNAPKHPFSSWLDDLFGNPSAAQTDLLKNIHHLCAPFVLTTNYDPLVTTTSSFPLKAYDWSEYQQVLRQLNEDQQFVFHLHGRAEKPETIILSESDYETLAEVAGYKEVLKKLWMDYHFLFIGCSRDGVLDPDFSTIIEFLNKWFPGHPHRHFILMHESDINKGLHKELLNSCNIEAISFGNDYSLLPGFIEHFNPNKEKYLQKDKAIRLRMDHNLPLNIGNSKTVLEQETVNEFIKEYIPAKFYLSESPSVAILDEVLNRRNDELKSLREKVRMYQSILQGLIQVSELSKQIAQWELNWMNILQIDLEQYIPAALLAYECLMRIPKNILYEINFRDHTVIHSHFFEGHLGNEVRMYKHWRDRSRSLGLPELDIGRYRLENFKRIMASLRGFLSVNPDKMFADANTAKPGNIIYPSLLVVSASEISIHSVANVDEKRAVLPVEPGLSFADGIYVWQGDRLLILGHNGRDCFYWDPQTAHSANIFYASQTGILIGQMLSHTLNGDVYCYVYTNRTILVFKNFVKNGELRPRIPIYKLLINSATGQLFGTQMLSYNHPGPFVFAIERDGSCRTIFTKDRAWEILEKTPFYAGQEDEDGFGVFMQNEVVKVLQFDNFDVLSVKLRVAYGQAAADVIILLQETNADWQAIKVIILPDKSTITFDMLGLNGVNELVCGYLVSAAEPSVMVEIIKMSTEGPSIIEANNTLILARSEGPLNQDVNQVKWLSAEKIGAVVSNHALLIINAASGETKKYRINDPLKVIQINRQ